MLSKSNVDIPVVAINEACQTDFSDIEDYWI